MTVLTAGHAVRRWWFNERFTYDTVSNATAQGWMDYANRELHLHAQMSQDKMHVTLDLVASWENLPPLVRLSAETPVVECDAPGTGTVRLVGEVSDADGSVTETFWVIDRRYVEGGPVLEQHLPLGEHTITLWAVDDQQARAYDTVQVQVVDTTPPVIGPGEAALYCTWPPNHKYVKLSVDNQVLVSDVCDPDPVVRIEGATSSEPDNALGDGDTTNDIVLLDGEGVCLRSERTGTGDGRTYQISVSAEDQSGNTASGSFDVAVFHDEGHGDCPRLPSRAFVPRGEEAQECPLPPAGATGTLGADHAEAGGCSAGRAGSGIMVLVLALLGLCVVRRRRA